ncbi:hypothetical protein BY996DRAFT_6415745 [Phakopsora pachyrhizi]|nr:hypothetical protein BY996DRAFT_6415745 [Phakopsora pachyrhizi]
MRSWAEGCLRAGGSASARRRRSCQGEGWLSRGNQKEERKKLTCSHSGQWARLGVKAAAMVSTRDDRESYKEYGRGLTGAAFLQDVAGPTGQEAGFNTRNAASGAAIARRVSKNRHWQRPQKEEGSTQVATVAENYQKREQAGLGRVGTDIAGPTNILQDRRRKGLGGGVRVDNHRADGGKSTLQRNKDCLTDKEAVGREEAGGRPEQGMGGGKEDIKRGDRRHGMRRRVI